MTDEHGVPRVKVIHCSRVVTKQQITKPTQTEAKAGQSFAFGTRFRLLDWVEDLVLVDVGIVFVVTTVTHSPHVIRTPQKAVHDGADDVVEQREFRERPVPAVVADHKHGGEECALNCPVE